MPMLATADLRDAGISTEMGDEAAELTLDFGKMRFLVADDHPLYREAVRAQIERMFAGAAVEEVNSIEELFCRFADAELAFDLILLDLYMPGMSPDAVRRIATHFSGSAIAVISGAEGSSAIRRCIEAGARGFIPKTATGDHLAHALQILLSGGTTVPAQVLFADGHEADRPEGSLAPALDRKATGNLEPWVQTLTERELAVLRGVVRGESNKQIARALGIAEVTVKFHLRVLFRKIGVNRRAQVAVAASKAGIG